MLPRLSLLLVTMLAVSAATAKGVTARIIISGGGLAEPIVITDPAILGRFSIWSGPSSGWVRDGEVQPDYQGTFMDFPAGPADSRPAELVHFDVAFQLADSLDSEAWDHTYRVEYAIHPNTPGGFFFLPDLPENTALIHHGVEGSWFNSTDEWEASVRPLIEDVIHND